jgi:HlyD family secretion protein
MNKKKKIILIIVAVVVVLGLVWMFSGSKRKFKATFESELVQKRDISSSVTATGTVEPVTEVEVGTQVSGIVSHLYADYNSEVKKGQIIAELDKTNLLNELSSARSNLASSKSEYDYQLKNYTRMKTLHEKQLISDDEYENALLTYEKAKNTYAANKVQVNKAETNLGYATITSPIDGIVLSREVEEGQTVNAGMNTPTLFNIARDLTDMRVIANVDEADIGGVEVGQRVTFSVDAQPNDTFEGQVTQVRLEATEESNVITYEVVISAPNPDLKLKPGMTANVTIYTLERNDVVTVPAKALRFTPTEELIGPKDTIEDCEAAHKVWVREGNKLKAYAVEVGLSNGSFTEILSGVKEGTRVLTEITVGSMPGQAAVDEQSSSTEERSPFAPTPPGSKKK